MKVTENVIIVGKPKEEVLNDFLISSLTNLHSSFTATAGLIFYRCIVNNILFYSKSYTRTKKRNSFTVLYTLNGLLHFGIIEYFVCVSVCGYFEAYAHLSQLLQREDNKSHFELTHNALDYGVPRIALVHTGPAVLVPVTCLLCKCVSVMVSSHQYVCIPPNTLSID